MPRTRPPAGAANDRLVFIDACGAMGAAPGLYRVSELTDVSYGAPPALHARPLASARSRKEAAELVARAEFLISSNSCSSAQRQVTNDGFTLVANRTSLSLYLRDHD
jgi:hypothetical protein